MSAKKKVGIIEILLLLVVIVIAALLFKTDFVRLFNRVFYNKEIENISLSNSEKLEDFDYYFNVIKSSIPMLNDYKAAYGIDFIGRVNYYKTLITSTNSDFEYYCVLEAIMEDIPSFHTDLVFPEDTAYENLNCYNSRNVLATRQISNYAEYWYRLLKEECMNNQDLQFTYFRYLQGKYIYVSQYSTDEYDIADGSEIISIDGVDIDTYITSNVSLINLYYDGHYAKPCRACVVFNESTGTPVDVEFETPSGEVIHQRLFRDLPSEAIYLYKDALIKSNSQYDNQKSSFAFCELDNDTAYLKIDNFANNEGEVIRRRLQDTHCNNIIIDLRDNWGGRTDYAGRYIYPMLFSTDLSIQKTWYMLDSSNNKKIFDTPLSYFFLRFVTVENPASTMNDNRTYLSSILKQMYFGNAKLDKNIYVLISHKTGSAADKFAAVLKDNGLGTLIGENTAGEGLMNSYIADILPNSKLVFIYSFGKAFNKDGTDNSTFGTVPDFYVDTTLRAFTNNIETIGKIEDIQARLLWDDVFFKAVELIKDGMQ